MSCSPSDDRTDVDQLYNKPKQGQSCLNEAVHTNLSVTCPHKNLRRHILYGSTECIRHVTFHDRLLAQTEVCEFDMTLGVKKNVLWFEIPINDSWKATVCIMSPVEVLSEEFRTERRG